MPRQVDHDERRDEIARALWRIATVRGLQGVTFRQVAAEAGVSVSLVQHYFGTKAGLLVWSLDRNTARMGARIATRLAALPSGSGAAGSPPDPVEVLRIVAASFVPTDPGSREAMLVYHAFAAAALTDEVLRTGAGFDNATVLVDHLTAQLQAAADAGALVDGVDPVVEANSLLALVIGLSLAVLLGRTGPADAIEAIDRHLELVVADGAR